MRSPGSDRLAYDAADAADLLIGGEHGVDVSGEPMCAGRPERSAHLQQRGHCRAVIDEVPAEVIAEFDQCPLGAVNTDPRCRDALLPVARSVPTYAR